MPHPCRRALQCLAFPLFFLVLFPTLALSQPAVPSLVRDINPGLVPEEWSGVPQLFFEWKGIVYFYNIDPAHGAEVWRTDGTEEGTWLLKDVLPGPLSSEAGSSTFVVGDSLYFLAFDGDSNYGLWKSDGTEAGTVPFLPGFEGLVRPFVVDDTLHFYRGCLETGPCELWKSDGTVAGTVKLSNLTMPPGFTNFSPLGGSGGIFFFAYSSHHSTLHELWRTDGTEAGTFLIRRFDIPTGQDRGITFMGTYLGGTFIFNAWDDTWGNGLWKSDGTMEGTVRLKDVHAFDMKVIGGTLYFSSLTLDEPFGSELWKSDGTEAGTVPVKDIVPGPGSSYASLLGKVGENLLVLTWNPETGFEIWKTDGSEEGTLFVRDIVPGPDDYIDWLTIANGLLYFTIDDGVHGSELWKSDGTAEGTRIVKDIVPGPGSTHIFAPGGGAGKLFFWGDDRVHGHELWVSDGTEEGTGPLKDLVQATSSVPYDLTVSGDHLFFVAADGSQGTELWKTDGTPEGTVLAHDLVPGPSSSYPFELTDVEGTLYFDLGLNQIWRTDGTPGGLVHELTLPSIRGMAEAGGKLFVAAGELYAAGTGLVKDIRPGSQGSEISQMTRVGSTLFFRADDGGGFGLWRSDGTTATTFEIAPVAARQLTAAGNVLFFTVLEESSWTRTLWRSDGTSAGTVQIASWSPGDVLYELTDADGTLYFGLSLQAGGQELWKSDGTPAGTVRVRRVSDSLSPLAELTSASRSLFFTAEDAGGRELWKSDGTETGTLRVKDVFPGPQGSHPAWLVDAGGRLVFAATDPDHGREVWVSDGTPEGTFPVGDVAPGARSSWPEELTPWNGKVYFSADDGTTGIELWSFQLEPDVSSVMGAGWFALPQGKGIFQLDAHSKKGTPAPEGKAQLKAPGVDFRSLSFDLLVAQGPTAWLTGEGAVNGEGGYRFRIAVTDGQAGGGGGVDRIRIWIQDGSGSRLVFDNEPGTSLTAPPATALGGGTIQIRRKGK